MFPNHIPTLDEDYSQKAFYNSFRFPPSSLLALFALLSELQGRL